VAHSLGGLIVQDALLYSNRAEKSSVLTCTYGIVFLGTPCFSLEERWVPFVSSVARITNSIRSSNVETFAQLVHLSSKFSSWRKTPFASRISIWSFYEVLPTDRMGIVRRAFLSRIVTGKVLIRTNCSLYPKRQQ
jgi:hypothetical protein